eukprot:12879505-Ditylum_brightwellii.AAC.1
MKAKQMTQQNGADDHHEVNEGCMGSLMETELSEETNVPTQKVMHFQGGKPLPFLDHSLEENGHLKTC